MTLFILAGYRMKGNNVISLISMLAMISSGESIMASLLIRDISEATKKALAISAAENGRSQQAEARAILESALDINPTSWIDMLREGSHDVGGIDIPLPERHTPRITGVLL